MDPGGLVVEWWRLVLGATAAVALVAGWRPVPRQDGEARPVLGARSRAALAVAAGLVCAAVLASGPPPSPSVAASPEWITLEAPPPPRFTLLSPEGWSPVLMLSALVMAGTVAVVLLRMAPLVRRRVLVLAAPAAAVALLVAGAFNGFLVSTVRFDPPVYLVPPQWIVLAVTPVLTLVAGVWLVARFERKAASGALLRYPAG